MKKLLLFAILFITSPSYAAGGWYCDQVASEWMDAGKVLKACGIGKGADENEARLNAFNNAQKEFNKVCDKDTACANKIINIDPQRSECSGPTSPKDGFTCSRLFHFRVTEENRKPPEKPAPVAPTPTKIEHKTIINKVENITNNNQFIKVDESGIREITVIREMPRGNAARRDFIRQSGRVSVYSTNSRQYQGVYLTNPSEDEIERAIKRGNTSGGVNAVYIYNP